MFGLFDVVDNVLDIGSSLLSGEDISRQQVAKLISDGIEVYAIASMFGVAESVILDLLKA